MGKYDDILEMQPPRTFTEMSMIERAAQFSAFAALSGFDEAIDDAELKMLEIAKSKSSPETDFWD